MAVIQNVDRMVTNLNSLLMNNTNIVEIHSTNISELYSHEYMKQQTQTQVRNKHMSVGICFPELQVQQKILSEVSDGSAVFGLHVGNGDRISIQAKDIKELHNNGRDF